MDRHPQEVGRKQIFQAIIRGLLPYYILNLLEKPHHGLEIANKIEVATGGAWAPSAGTLYPMLRRMETDGLIGGEWQRSTGAPRRVYKLLNEGRKERKQLRKSLIEELELASIVVDTHLQALRENRRFSESGDQYHAAQSGPPDPALKVYFDGLSVEGEAPDDGDVGLNGDVERCDDAT